MHETAAAAPVDVVDPPRAVPVEVVGVRQLSPHMVRITVAGDGIRRLDAVGGDHWFRLFLPASGQPEPLLPSSENWWPEMCAMAEDIRPIVRNYTVRKLRPMAGEMDVDIVRHGDTGPATSWAGRARVGDRIGVLDQSRVYSPPPQPAWQLLVGDESALPAIGSIIEDEPRGARTLAVIEIPAAADEQTFDTAGDLTVHWLPRRPGDRVGTRALSALRILELPTGCPATFLAGEQRMVREVRRHLVGQRRFARESVAFMTYWRADR